MTTPRKKATAKKATAKKPSTPSPEPKPAPGPVVLVLRPGWVHDPYRLPGLVIPAGVPTEVTEEQAAHILAAFPEAFTVEK